MGKLIDLDEIHAAGELDDEDREVRPRPAYPGAPGLVVFYQFQQLVP